MRTLEAFPTPDLIANPRGIEAPPSGPVVRLTQGQGPLIFLLDDRAKTRQPDVKLVDSGVPVSAFSTQRKFSSDTFGDDMFLERATKLAEIAILFGILAPQAGRSEAIPTPAEQQLIDETFHASSEDSEKRTGLRTDAVVILQNNKIIFEKYGRDCHASRKHISWSIAKSLTNAIVGHAVLKHGFDLKKNACPGKEPACQIPAQALLEMSSGLSWSETYEKAADPTQSDVIRMLYGEGHADSSKYVRERPMAGPPQSFWRYSSGDPILLLSAVRHHFQGRSGPESFKSFLEEFLSRDLGLKNYTFESDATGLPRGASHFYATARDFAQLGSLFLNDGVLNGKRLLPEGWVKYSTTPVPAYLKERRDWDSRSVGGAAWWLNTEFPDRPNERPWPSAPKDTYLAQGHWGQAVAVIPSLKVVAVRLGDTRNRSDFTNDGFLKSVIRFVESQPPTIINKKVKK